MEQDDMMVASIHPKPAPHSSSSRFRQYSPSGAGMPCNLSLSDLLTYKIYKIGLSICLQLFANLNTPRRDAL